MSSSDALFPSRAYVTACQVPASAFRPSRMASSLDWACGVFPVALGEPDHGNRVPVATMTSTSILMTGLPRGRNVPQGYPACYPLYRTVGGASWDGRPRTLHSAAVLALPPGRPPPTPAGWAVGSRE